MYACMACGQDHVFINQYLIIKDLGKGAYGTVKLVYNTEDDMLYAMKVQDWGGWATAGVRTVTLGLSDVGAH